MKVVLDQDRDDLGGNLRHGDMSTWSPRLWNHILDRFAIKSALDVGCGEGHAASYFFKRGIVSHGIDGLTTNIKRSVYPIALHDILAGPYFMPVDLVWSCEVAEHIDPRSIENYTSTLANGKIIAMTHALPGQTGHNHVNCQPPEYWINMMKLQGYELDSRNDVYRSIAASEPHFNYFIKSGLVFLRT